MLNCPTKTSPRKESMLKRTPIRLSAPRVAPSQDCYWVVTGSPRYHYEHRHQRDDAATLRFDPIVVMNLAARGTAGCANTAGKQSESRSPRLFWFQPLQIFGKFPCHNKTVNFGVFLSEIINVSCTQHSCHFIPNSHNH